MIISSPVINGLLRATDKAIPGKADGELSVPNVLMPAYEPILPLTCLSDTASPPNESILAFQSIDKINPNPAGGQLIATLGAGLWSLDLLMVGATVGTAGTYTRVAVQVAIWYQGVLNPWVFENCYSGALQKHIIARQGRFLFRDQVQIYLYWLAPAAGERYATDVSLAATKHL